MRFRFAILAALAIATPAAADNELAIARSVAPVADQVNTLTPARNLPGSTLDYMETVTNPLGNVTLTIKRVVITDPVPAAVRLRVIDLNAGTGPVEFMQGNLLPIPLGASGLSYAYGGLGDVSDGLEFFDGSNWGYVPHDQGDGYDGNVRAIRVTLTGTRFATAGSFRLRYRVMLK